MGRNAAIVIANACIWGFVLIATSSALKGTDGYEKIQLILQGGAAASLMVLSTVFIKKPKK